MNIDVRAKKTEVDLSKVESSYQLHQLLKIKLGLPAVYGMNWDAFWDAITGMIELPLMIEFKGWKEFCINNSYDAKILKEIMQRYNDEFPTLYCVIVYK